QRRYHQSERFHIEPPFDVSNSTIARLCEARREHPATEDRAEIGSNRRHFRSAARANKRASVRRDTHSHRAPFSRPFRGQGRATPCVPKAPSLRSRRRTPK